MNTNDPRRSWRVTLDGGETIIVAGAKVLVTDSGALMILDRVGAANPVRIFAANAWSGCVELPPGGRKAVLS
jgi:hypothetical protein